MAIQIPKGDQLGWVLPKPTRPNIQGGDDPVGRAAMGVGREIAGVAIGIHRRDEYKKEKEKDSLDKLGMANAAIDYQKSQDAIGKEANDKVLSGELEPDQVKDYVRNARSKLSIDDYIPRNLSDENRAFLELNFKKIDYSSDTIASGIQEKGMQAKAATSINQLISNLKESNVTPDKAFEMLDSDDTKTAATLAYGLKSKEAIDNFKRDYAFGYLQNHAITSADDGNYKALRQLKTSVNNPDFYKGILQQEDRTKISHAASNGMDRLESKWKTNKILAKQAETERYNSLRDDLYWQMSKEGKFFDELDQEKVNQLKPKDYEYFKTYKTVKNDDLKLLEETIYKINNGEDVDLTGDKMRENMTSPTIESLVKKRANIKNNKEKENNLFSLTTLFGTRAKVNGVMQGTDNYMKLQNETIDAIETTEKKLGRKLSYKEKLNLIDDQFVQGYIKGGGNLFGDSNFRTPYFKAEDKSKFYINRASDIPVGVKDILRTKFSERGIKASDKQLIDAYNSYLQQGN